MNLDKRDELLVLFEKYQNFLTQTQKQAMHLYLVEDLSLREVSDILAVSRQSVHDAIKKGEAKLQSIEEKMG